MQDLDPVLYSSRGRSSTLRYRPQDHTLPQDLEEDEYGVVFCQGSNRLGMQRIPCVFFITPAGESIDTEVTITLRSRTFLLTKTQLNAYIPLDTEPEGRNKFQQRLILSTVNQMERLNVSGKTWANNSSHKHFAEWRKELASCSHLIQSSPRLRYMSKGRWTRWEDQSSIIMSNVFRLGWLKMFYDIYHPCFLTCRWPLATVVVTQVQQSFQSFLLFLSPASVPDSEIDMNPRNNILSSGVIIENRLQNIPKQLL